MCVHARIPLSRSASTFGKLVARLSSNFYSLSGTDDKKTAQTESPRSFLSRYTCSFPSLHLLNFLVHHPLTLSPFVPSTSSPSCFPFSTRPTVFSVGRGSPKACFNSSSSSRFHDAPLVDLLPSHRRVPRKFPWFRSSTRQDFIDSIATEQSVPPPPRITFTRNFVLPGNFLITTADACFILFLSLLFFSSFTLFALVSFLFFFWWATLLTLRFLWFRSFVYTFFEPLPFPSIE